MGILSGFKIGYQSYAIHQGAAMLTAYSQAAFHLLKTHATDDSIAQAYSDILWSNYGLLNLSMRCLHNWPMHFVWNLYEFHAAKASTT